MSDSARKRTIADWVVKTKKQVVKLYAVMKWSRDARDVQKAMVRLQGYVYNKKPKSNLILEHNSVSYGPKQTI